MGDVLERTAFRTSRLLDFVSQKELTDNALDACEEQGIATEITVTIEEDAITVADNGAGIPPDVVDLLLEFSIRVSSREAYVAPDRGAQGNALKTIVAMPFVLDGEEGRVNIVGGGVESRISFCVDRIRQSPASDVERSRKDGSLVRIYWPAETGSEDLATDQFLQDVPEMPLDLDHQIAEEFERDPTQSWDQALWVRTAWNEDDDEDEDE